VKRIRQLISGKPLAGRIWLNDLQGAPSACGCGHPLCRCTADYGPVLTATPAAPGAAARFVAAIEEIAPFAEIIPIFAGECEAEDRESVCCGVACFEGRCWKDFTIQLDAVARETEQIGISCFYKYFDRDLPRYGAAAGWIAFAIDSFSTMPRLRNGTGVPPHRLIAILQGWDVTEEQVSAQIDQAKRAHSAGWMIVLSPIDQSWKPVIFDLPEANPSAPGR
jgi:hypothetical protein